MYVPIIKYPWGGSFCPEAFAEAKLTGSGLKFRLWCCEKHPRVTMTKPNSLVCLDSCLEVFLNPYPDFTRDYLNFEMNAAGTLLLQKGPDRAHRSFVNLAVPHYPQVHAWQLPGCVGRGAGSTLCIFAADIRPRSPRSAAKPCGQFLPVFRPAAGTLRLLVFSPFPSP